MSPLELLDNYQSFLRMGLDVMANILHQKQKVADLSLRISLFKKEWEFFVLGTTFFFFRYKHVNSNMKSTKWININ